MRLLENSYDELCLEQLMGSRIRPGEHWTGIRMDPAEIQPLDQQNALLELKEILARAQIMVDVNYAMDLSETWEYLDLWSAGGNSEATKLLLALEAALERAGSAIDALSSQSLTYLR